MTNGSSGFSGKGTASPFFTDGDTTRYIDFNAFVAEYIYESDRAIVLLSVAKIDDLLCQLLQYVLRPNPEKNDELFAQEKPLSTLSARINMSYRLGLIDEEFCRALHLMRKIRNHCAHHHQPVTLDEHMAANWVRELAKPFSELPYFKSARQRIGSSVHGPMGQQRTAPSLDFLTVAAFAMKTLVGLPGRIRPIHSTNPSPLMRR